MEYTQPVCVVVLCLTHCRTKGIRSHSTGFLTEGPNQTKLFGILIAYVNVASPTVKITRSHEMSSLVLRAFGASLCSCTTFYYVFQVQLFVSVSEYGNSVITGSGS